MDRTIAPSKGRLFSRQEMVDYLVGLHDISKEKVAAFLKSWVGALRNEVLIHAAGNWFFGGMVQRGNAFVALGVFLEPQDASVTDFLGGLSRETGLTGSEVSTLLFDMRRKFEEMCRAQQAFEPIGEIFLLPVLSGGFLVFLRNDFLEPRAEGDAS